MKNILVATNNQKACEAVRDCFHTEYTVDVVRDKASCYEMFRKKRYEYSFIDILFLQELPANNGSIDYKKTLQPFWQVHPSAEIVVLSPQDIIREAVNAVKAGASNYLTDPINRADIQLMKARVDDIADADLPYANHVNYSDLAHTNHANYT